MFINDYKKIEIFMDPKFNNNNITTYNIINYTFTDKLYFLYFP